MGVMSENTVLQRKHLPGRELAFGITATLLFFASALFIPIFGAFAGIFAPLPTLTCFYRWGSPLGYGVPLGSALLGGLLLWRLDLTSGLPYLGEMLALGLLLATGMRRHWSLERTVALASLLIFATGALVVGLSVSWSEGGLFAALEEELKRAITVALQQYGEASSAETQLWQSALQEQLPTLVRLFPGAGLSSALVVSWLNLLVVKRYCRLHRLPMPSWVEWSRWKAPEPLVWAVIAGGAAFLIPVFWVSVAGLNILMVLGVIYFLQGLAVLTFYFEKWRLPKILRAILYGLLLLQHFIALGTILMGLFDLWLDFRRLSQKPASDL